MTKVWEWSSAEGNELLVMLALADFCDDDGVCYPGIARIAKKSRLSERTVRRIIDSMIEKGEIVKEVGGGIEVKGERGSHHTNKYTLQIRAVNLTGQSEKGRSNQSERAVKNAEKGGHGLADKPSVFESSVEEPSETTTQIVKVSLLNGGDFVESWNSLGSPFKPISQSTKGVSDVARALPEGWESTLSKIKLSPYLRGETTAFPRALTPVGFIKLYDRIAAGEFRDAAYEAKVEIEERERIEEERDRERRQHNVTFYEKVGLYGSEAEIFAQHFTTTQTFADNQAWIDHGEKFTTKFKKARREKALTKAAEAAGFGGEHNMAKLFGKKWTPPSEYTDFVRKWEAENLEK